ncbi:MAG: Rpn family recombination-promoting nuclease/putative transposase [Clostridiales bacterium]|nr:Rpn family recombination-promoting nuclease/putative transposase [Clostridiales bacterium]
MMKKRITKEQETIGQEEAGQEKKEETKGLLSLTNDYVFRRILGQENVDSLADLLASVLDMQPDELEKLTVDDPNMFRKNKKGKNNELDVRVHTKSGDILDVEIQVHPQDAFENRISYLNSRIFSEQMKRGGIYEDLNRAISVVITGFTLFEGVEDCHNRFMWYNPDNNVILTDAQEINTLELTKLPEANDGTRLWEWLRFISSGKEEEMEALAENNKAMKDVIVTLREMSEDEAERRLAEAREKELRDRHATRMYGEKEGEARGIEIGKAQGIEIGKEQGIEIGKEQGIEIGKAQEKYSTTQDIARGMKAYGDPTDKIAIITGLAEEEINAL